MKVLSRTLLLCCLSVTPIVTLAQSAAPARPPVGSQVPPSQIYGRLLSNFEKEIVDLADAMPEDKYEYLPSQGEYKGVNNFAEQVKHIAGANYEFFGKTANADPSAEAAVEKLKSKAEIMKALRESFLVAHKAVDGMTAQNAFEMTANGTRAGAASLALAHMMDHYGQLVEYMRLNGIIPPASRKTASSR